MASSKPTIFFSPGGFHTPWIYDTVRRILSNRGFATEASYLVSVGTTDASVGMLSDAKHLRSLLTKTIDEGKEVVVVAHSYGGVIVSNAVDGLSVAQRAAEGKQGGILMILYLAALIIPAGKNFWAIVNPNSVPWDDTGVNLSVQAYYSTGGANEGIFRTAFLYPRILFTVSMPMSRLHWRVKPPMP